MVNITPPLGLILFIYRRYFMDERIILNTDGKIDLTIPKDFEEYDNTIDIGKIYITSI